MKRGGHPEQAVGTYYLVISQTVSRQEGPRSLDTVVVGRLGKGDQAGREKGDMQTESSV